MRIKIKIPFALCLFVFSACKKETIQPQPTNATNPDRLPVAFSDYPDNFLKIGNYWIYNLQQFSSNANDFDSTTYTDSVFVEALDITAAGDTFYKLTHVRGSQWGTYNYTEMFRITSSGAYANNIGESFNYLNLPSVSDSLCASYKGTYMWNNYVQQDTVVLIKTQCCELPAGKYTSQKVSDNDFGSVVGNKTIYFTRGIGIVRYNKSELWGTGEQRQLLRFHIQR